MELLDDLGIGNVVQIRKPERKHYFIYAGVQLLLFVGLYVAVKSGIVAYYVEVLEAKEGGVLCGLIIFATLIFYHFTITIISKIYLFIGTFIGVSIGLFVAVLGTSLIVDIDVDEHELIAFCLWLGYLLGTASLPPFIAWARRNLIVVDKEEES
ncbi:MAG: hypothetical protein GY810_13335 [Aureispira sp.]|nr:hypothetical protein [Aureispira sp.]